MPTVRFDQFYRYESLTQILQAFATEFPHLVKLESLGQSYDGREIWILRVTCFATGPDWEKPALWVDGNIHSVELAGSTACLYLLQTLVQGYGVHAEITRCLETRTFYICPRVNPDGAEWALADRPKFIRSSTRPYPYDEEPLTGLRREDIDGDGRILSMRIPDPNGAWKVCPDDPRLMMRRDPTEMGGTYYRILPEGQIRNYDGVLIDLQLPKEGLDLNCNFPAQWRQAHEQKGAGPYPGSEAETRSLVQFFTNHPNITGAIAFHTYGGLLLRPYSHRCDDEMPIQDLRTYQRLGQEGSKLTGYPAVSVFHGFRSDPTVTMTGAFDDWAYEHQGVFAWTVEIWSLQRQAGIADYKHFDWFREHPLADDLKLLQWNDEHLGENGYVDWYPFKHPQLGSVELGGWNNLYTWTNPPPAMLEQEAARFPDWLVWHLLISPRLEIYGIEVFNLGKDSYRIRLVIHNTGWLPTYITQQALKNQVVRGCICQIELPEDAALIMGKQREDVGQLEGRAYKPAMPSSDPTRDRAKVEWIVQAPMGTTVKLTAKHDRAGVTRSEIELR